MQGDVSRCGTVSRYTNGKCRCEACTAAHTEYGRKKRSGEFAGRQELGEWMRGLGWDRAIPGAIPKVFVDRWNRENPERPYIAS